MKGTMKQGSGPVPCKQTVRNGYVFTVVPVSSQRARSPKRVHQQQKRDPRILKPITRFDEQNKVNTVVKFLKVDEKNASTDTHKVCCLHHKTCVDG